MINILTFSEFINEAKVHKLKYDYFGHYETIGTKLQVQDDLIAKSLLDIMNHEWSDWWGPNTPFITQNVKWEKKMNADFDWCKSIFVPGKSYKLKNGMEIIFHKDPEILMAKIPNYTVVGYVTSSDPIEAYIYCPK